MYVVYFMCVLLEEKTARRIYGKDVISDDISPYSVTEVITFMNGKISLTQQLTD